MVARVLHAKGGKSRTVGMDAAAFAVLRLWMDARTERVQSPVAPLFCMLDGSPIYSSYIRVLLPRLGRRAGIAKRIHAHGTSTVTGANSTKLFDGSKRSICAPLKKGIVNPSSAYPNSRGWPNLATL